MTSGGPGDADAAISVVHLVAKTHLDLGFTALADEVAGRYVEEFFPAAIQTAQRLRSSGPERLVWTTGSWILHHALHDPDSARAHAVEAAVVRGDLTWHGLPVTTHTELMDADLVRSGLGISQELDACFGRTTTAAKMTDVPGHTRGLVPLLAGAGITFLHLGVNPAWPLPEVPPVFRWRSPDGAEVTVAYRSGGYGGQVVVPGCTHALAFLHTGDNLGPPTPDEVVAAHEALRLRFPGAEVRASTLDAFARALVSSGAGRSLPVVTAEIGDPWLFGAASDPQKVRGFRSLLTWRQRLADRLTAAECTDVDRRLLLVAEHTWGLDQKVVLPDEVAWDDGALEELRASAPGQWFERSWGEQRRYVDDAARSLQRSLRRAPGRDGDLRPWAMVQTLADQAQEVPSWPLDAAGAPVGGYRPLALDRPTPGPNGVTSHLDLTVSSATGAVSRLVHRPTGRVLADAEHHLGWLTHQTFSDDDYQRFYAQLHAQPDDEWWARRDNTKPGIASAGARAARVGPSVLGAWIQHHHGDAWNDVLVHLGFPDEPARHRGAPSEAWVRWFWPNEGDELTCTLWWHDKPATRLPEATWMSFVPCVDEPERWVMDKLGQEVSPLDVVRRGGRSLHAVGEGMHYRGPDGNLTIATPDAPLVAPGAPNLLDADPPLPDLAGGFHVLLHDNCWGTNFPMWNEGSASFRFTVALA